MAKQRAFPALTSPMNRSIEQYREFTPTVCTDIYFMHFFVSRGRDLQLVRDKDIRIIFLCRRVVLCFTEDFYLGYTNLVTKKVTAI
jgi:hypothetical protein